MKILRETVKTKLNIEMAATDEMIGIALDVKPDQVTLVPFGDPQEPALPADRPWPGRIPAPAPATVYPTPPSAVVTDSAGAVVTVTGRGQVSADPARLWDWLENHPRLPRADVQQLREWYLAACANRNVPLIRLHNLILSTERQLAQ